jgi:very-short-patch-repair endonuclease
MNWQYGNLSLWQRETGEGFMLIYNKNLKPYARKLRKEMTDSELRLWSNIRMKQVNGFQFYRQRVIENFIVDFFSPRAKLVIEVDGGQHYSDEMIKLDGQRDLRLKKLGLKVLRFSDTDVLTNIEGVIENIIEYLPN